MKYLCIKTCQVSVDKKSVFIPRGTVKVFDEDPGKNFRCLDNKDKPHTVDFYSAKAEEMQAAKWTFEEARLAIYTKYGVELKKEDGTRKSDIVEQILDIRFRAINPTIINVPTED